MWPIILFTPRETVSDLIGEGKNKVEKKRSMVTPTMYPGVEARQGQKRDKLKLLAMKSTDHNAIRNQNRTSRSRA